MEAALAIVTVLFFLVLFAASAGVCYLALRKQDETNRAIDDGFREVCERVTTAAVVLNNEAKQRHEHASVERIDVWMPPNSGCEICGSEAVVCCSGPDMRAVWLCGACYHEDGSFS